MNQSRVTAAPVSMIKVVAIKTVTDVPVDGAYNTLTLKSRQETLSHLTNMKEIDNH